MLSIQQTHAKPTIQELQTVPDDQAKTTTPAEKNTSDSLKNLQVGYQPKQVIFREGGRDRDLFILLSGQVHICLGKTVVATLSQKQTILGEMSMILGLPRTGTAIAATECSLLKISPKTFSFLFQHSPALGRKIQLTLAERLLQMNQRYEQLKQRVQPETQQNDDISPEQGEPLISFTINERGQTGCFRVFEDLKTDWVEAGNTANATAINDEDEFAIGNTTFKYMAIEQQAEEKDNAALGKLGDLLKSLQVKFESGQTIFKQGDTNRDLFIHLQGSIEILINDQPIATIDKPYEIIGEMSTILAQPRTATAKADSTCTLIRIPEKNLATIYQKSPALGIRLTRLLAQRLNAMNGKFQNLKQRLESGNSDPAQQALTGDIPVGTILWQDETSGVTATLTMYQNGAATIVQGNAGENRTPLAHEDEVTLGRAKMLYQRHNLPPQTQSDQQQSDTDDSRPAISTEQLLKMQPVVALGTDKYLKLALAQANADNPDNPPTPVEEPDREPDNENDHPQDTPDTDTMPTVNITTPGEGIELLDVPAPLVKLIHARLAILTQCDQFTQQREKIETDDQALRARLPEKATPPADVLNDAETRELRRQQQEAAKLPPIQNNTLPEMIRKRWIDRDPANTPKQTRDTKAEQGPVIRKKTEEQSQTHFAVRDTLRHTAERQYQLLHKRHHLTDELLATAARIASDQPLYRLLMQAKQTMPRIAAAELDGHQIALAVELDAKGEASPQQTIIAKAVNQITEQQDTTETAVNALGEYYANQIDPTELFGYAVYELALISLYTQHGAAAEELTPALKKLQDKANANKGLMNWFAAEDQDPQLTEAIDKLNARLNNHQTVQRMINLEMASLQKQMIQCFWQTYEQAAKLLCRDEYLPAEQQPPLRAFLRYGLLGNAPWLIAPKHAEAIVNECAQPQRQINIEPQAVNILYADEYIDLVTHRKLTPAGDEELELNERGSDRWKADMAWRSVVGSTYRQRLLEDLAEQQKQKIDYYQKKQTEFAEQKERIKGETDSARKKRREQEEAERRCALYQQWVRQGIEQINNKFIAAEEKAIETYTQMADQVPFKLTPEYFAAQEAQAIRRTCRLCNRLVEEFLPAVLRDKYRPSAGTISAKPIMIDMYNDVEFKDPTIYIENVIAAKQKERRVQLRFAPPLLVLPAAGVMGFCLAPRSSRDPGRLAMPGFTPSDRAREIMFHNAVADFRWNTSKIEAGGDMVTPGTLVADYAAVRWEYRNRARKAQRAAVFYMEEKENINFRRHYGLYLDSAEDGGAKLFYKCPEVYEMLLKYVKLPEGVDKLARG